jgi:TRAP-type C4-dicarboxylate transport system permease small subunit
MDPSPTPFVNYDFRTIDWRAVSVLIAALGIVLVFYFQWWRNRKRLSYDILSSVLLISAEEEIRDKVEIRFEGQPVKNVHLVVIKLINDGYVPIKKDDFEKPIRLIFSKAKILTAEKVKFNPDNLTTDIQYGEDWLEIEPALFNRKDYVQFKVLLTESTQMRIDARVVGVSRIRQVGSGLFDSEKLFAFTFLMMVLFGAYQWLKTGTGFYIDFLIPLILFSAAALVSVLRQTFRKE